MRLPGKALLVALLLWKEAGCRRSRTVRFRLGTVAEMGLHPDTARRGLQELEQAGLISIRREPGRALQITLLEAPPNLPV
jgi:hypothetical protein